MARTEKDEIELNTETRLLLLTYTELYLVRYMKDQDGNMFKIEGVLGLKKDSKLKSTPQMEILNSNHTSSNKVPTNPRAPHP